MSTSNDRVLDWERHQAHSYLKSAEDRLTQAGHSSCAPLVREAYQCAETALVNGRHLNPVHHTACVVDLMVEMMLEEMHRTPGGPPLGTISAADLPLGIIVAMFHDGGNAFEPTDEKKIRTADVRRNSSLRKPAVQQRSRHMQNGAVLLEATMRALTDWKFSDSDIAKGAKLVEHHDDPTIAELIEDPADKARYLFVPDDNHELSDIYPLSAVLREADRLWMLTTPGLVCDLKRNLAGGKSWDPPGQVSDNVDRHRKELKLYEEYVNATRTEDIDGKNVLSGWGFEEDTGFYRTAVGKKHFREFPVAAKALDNQAWIAQVVESWFISPCT